MLGKPAFGSAPEFEEAATLDPGDDPALRSFHEEVVRSLEIFGLVCPVIATASME